VKPRIADLFCGAGGAAMGLHRAGFEVVGFDIAPQPRYPFEFHQADALTVDLSGFDAVWASPPCQAYSIMRNLPWLREKEYPALILPTREMLEHWGGPYIIENVSGARHGAKGLRKRGLEAHGLKGGYLCGGMFGLPFYRHRYFETNWAWMQPGHPRHRTIIKRATQKMQQRPDGIRYGFDRHASNIGHGVGVGRARQEMGIDWMTRNELSQAIPPAYAEYLGRRLMAHMRKD